MKYAREDCEREHPSNSPCSQFWTREEREEHRVFAEANPDSEIARILDTVDALEEFAQMVSERDRETEDATAALASLGDYARNLLAALQEGK